MPHDMVDSAPRSYDVVLVAIEENNEMCRWPCYRAGSNPRVGNRLERYI